MSIVVKSLDYTYQPQSPLAYDALKGISLRIDEGDFVAIVGRTGSGKSTLIQHFNGLIRPRPGTVRVDDLDVGAEKTDIKEVRRRVGVVFQFAEDQLFEATVAGDVAYGPKNFGVSGPALEHRVKMALAAMGLDYDAVGQRPPLALSGGQRRKVALAGVLAMDPKYLILDEPTAGLDPRSRRDLLQHLRDLHAGGKTVVVVSHSMDEIAPLITKVIVLQDGTVALAGPPAEIFQDRDRLTALSLDVPEVTRLMMEVGSRGYRVRQTVFDIEEAADELERAGVKPT